MDLQCVKAQMVAKLKLGLREKSSILNCLDESGRPLSVRDPRQFTDFTGRRQLGLSYLGVQSVNNFKSQNI